MINFKNILNSKSSILIFITFFSIIFAYLFSALPIIEDLNLKSIDVLFRFRGPISPPDTSIVIVGIDDQTLASLPNKYPYPTSYYAKLVNNLMEAGAKLIVFDIEFSESSQNPALTETDENSEINSDLYFAKAVTDAQNVVLATKVVFDYGSHGTENFYILPLLAPLMRSPATRGLVNVFEDSDGFLRRYMLFQQIQNNFYYPLAIEAYKKLEKIEIDPDQDLAADTFILGSLRIPKKTFNSTYINFRGPAETFNTYSMASVIDDEKFDLMGDEDTDIFEMHKEWGTFKDKIVFVGATAEEMQDNKLTPFYEYEGRKQKMPGVEMHANALSMLLRGDFIKELNSWLIFIFVVLITFLATFITLYSRPVKAFLLIIIILLVTIACFALVFTKIHQIAFVSKPIISLFLTFLSSLTFKAITEQREKRRIKQVFKQYVAQNVVEKMLSSGQLPEFGGERKTITILFSDIRRFTTFSESHDPETVVSRLSEYLTEMVKVLFKYDGTLDKFVGDEIMALFGAPYYYTDHAERACYAALEMVEQLRQIQKRWSDSKHDIFHIGIGINTGKVIVGNLGSNQLFDYTAIGDEVNLGARLEGTNKEYQTTIILSESTYDLVKDKAKVRELDFVRVMGKTKPIRIYELRGMSDLSQIEQDYIIDIFTEGLQFYRDRCWSDALKSFRRVLRYFPSDGPSRVYTIRCLDYIENPPPPDWDGVYEFKKK